MVSWASESPKQDIFVSPRFSFLSLFLFPGLAKIRRNPEQNKRFAWHSLFGPN